MNLPEQIAKQLRELYFGENWTDVNVKDSLSGVSWEHASSKIYFLHTIADLVVHTNYYVCAATKVLQGNILDTNDKYSFDHAPISSALEWENLLSKTWRDAEILAGLIENMPESKLWDNFSHEKYGNYYRNLHGIIEHTHYHLGQIVLIKKIIFQGKLTVIA